MIINLKYLTWIAIFGSFALLVAAYGFEFLGGMSPCKMCLWQRWPHGFAILIGLIILFTKNIKISILGAFAALTTSIIGFYHAGVEQKWWEGPTTCTSNSIEGLSANDLLNQILAAPIARCDEIAWDLLGISMAGWNGLISLFLTIASRKFNVPNASTLAVY